MLSGLRSLMIIITTVWALTLVESYIIFIIIVPLSLTSINFGISIMEPVVKTGLAGALALFWIYAMLKIRNIYAKNKIFSKPEET